MMTPRVGLAVGSAGQTQEKQEVRKTWEVDDVGERLVNFANIMPKAQFLRITRKVTRDSEGSANDKDL